jgi:hypothetical protein
MGPVLVPLTGAARYAAIACGWLGDHPIEDIAGMVRKAEVEDAQEQEMADHSKAQWALNVILRENWRAGYVRDIFGNPFRPVAFSPEWRTDTALTLARQMYEAREFGAMPILADALQDAGCDNPDILDHCRGPGPHVRGCWVVDLVLGLS